MFSPNFISFDQESKPKSKKQTEETSNKKMSSLPPSYHAPAYFSAIHQPQYQSQRPTQVIPSSPKTGPSTPSSHPTSHRLDLSPKGTHNPYGTTYSEYLSSTPPDSSSPSEVDNSLPPSPSGGCNNITFQHGTPLQYNPTAYPPHNTVHVPLWNRCEFIQIPAMFDNVDYTPVNNALSLFIGQVRFEATAAELKWLLQYVAGVVCTKVEHRGLGCFSIFLKSEAEIQAIHRIHKRVLFDHSGVWFARTVEECEALFDYVSNRLPYISRKAHLPRDSLVVEEQKSKGSSGSFYHHQQQFLKMNPQQAFYEGEYNNAPMMTMSAPPPPPPAYASTMLGSSPNSVVSSPMLSHQNSVHMST